MNKIIITYIFILIASSIHAQQSPVRFQSLTINDGLSLSSVYCIHRDSKGFMWFGTEDGLNKFDGYRFQIYRTDIKNPNSICYKWIEHITEDNNGQLWFGSRNGLSCFNPKNETFTNFTTDSKTKLTNDTITCIMPFNNFVLAGTTNGINIINSTTLGINNSEYPNSGRINDLCVDKEHCWIASNKGMFCFYANGEHIEAVKEMQNAVNDLYIVNNTIYGCTNNKVFEYNTSDDSFKFHYPFGKSNSNNIIESILVDNNKRIWLGTNNGLFLYNTKTKKIKRIISSTDSSNSLAINSNKPLKIDSDNNIWFGTHGDGLFRITPDLKVTGYIHNPTDNNSINQNSFNCIYPDLITGNIWFGTFGAGINIYHPGANKFDLIKHNPLNINSLPSNFIWSIFETNDNCIWIGTNDKGVCRYNPATNQYTTFDHAPEQKTSLSNSTVRKVYQDSQGNIWIGTDGGGLNLYNKNNNTFKHYKYDKSNPKSISDNSVRALFEDSKKRLWVGTRNGLNYFDIATGQFARYMHNPDNSNSLSHNFVYSTIIEDKQGYLWIGTYGGGLNKLDPETNFFFHYTTNGEKGKSLSNNIVFSVYEDTKGLIWIGTNEGLNILDPATGLIKVYGTIDGLPNEVVYGIMPDEDENIWLSTNYGVCCINPQTMDCFNYDVSDGLQSNEFNGGAFHKGKSGKLYFGGVYGLNILNTASLQQNKIVSKPIITKLEVLGNKVYTSSSFTGEKGSIIQDGNLYYTDTNISYAKHITLNYNQRFFAIEYSGLNHLFPNKTEYDFMLHPIDKKWNKAGQRNYVSFANLKPGDYEFRVKNTNSDGIWGNEQADLKITISPPFWLSTWFIILEIIIVAIIIIFIYRYLLKIKTNQLLRIQNQQIKSTNIRLQQSEESLKQSNATKDKFFSIISHDLKNPFASLMSISKMLAENYDNAEEEDKKDGINRIHSSIKQIYALLENLLTWSRCQRGKISFEPGPFDLSRSINENINLYKLAAEKKEISLINKTSTNTMAYGDRNSVNTIIRNLTSNAIKFTRPGGTVTISVDEYENMWKISVSDNGIGIASENKYSLFDIDKKVKNDGTAGEKGTGLGLLISKEFAEKNGGQIGVESKTNEGSTFWFTIRKTNDNNLQNIG